MCTQQLNTLQEGRGVWALFLNHKGGLLTTARIWKSPASSSACGFVPDAFLIIMPPGRQAVLLQHLQKHIVSEEVELRPELSSLCVLELAGPMAPKGLCSLEALAKQHEEFLMYLPGSLEGVALLTGKRLERLAPEVFPSLDEAHWEGLRMEYGRAAWGKELEAGCLATEFRLDWAIHPAKGCYVGQEAVTRTTFRTVPRKRLGAFVAEDGQEGRLLARGTALWNQSQEVGKVLSSSLSPTFGSVLAMARVLRAHAEPGQVLSTSEGLKLRAVELPLWKAAPSSA
jgi:folate-binding protein YgfZ